MAHEMGEEREEESKRGGGGRIKRTQEEALHPGGDYARTKTLDLGGDEDVCR